MASTLFRFKWKDDLLIEAGERTAAALAAIGTFCGFVFFVAVVFGDARGWEMAAYGAGALLVFLVCTLAYLYFNRRTVNSRGS